MADKDLHARLVIHNIEDMTEADLKRLHAWLHAQAEAITVDTQKDYSRKFTARLWK